MTPSIFFAVSSASSKGALLIPSRALPLCFIRLSYLSDIFCAEEFLVLFGVFKAHVNISRAMFLQGLIGFLAVGCYRRCYG